MEPHWAQNGAVRVGDFYLFSQSEIFFETAIQARNRCTYTCLYVHMRKSIHYKTQTNSMLQFHEAIITQVEFNGDFPRKNPWSGPGLEPTSLLLRRTVEFIELNLLSINDKKLGSNKCLCVRT